ncbi:MAG TPA: pyruvate dehydrogenase complex dihydrolipoamide acetyltransferase, partial [Chitinophagaceae bacterium]|nr:pyruvate dehydrogenase complex dihydrolipoamide acetyltransferase [Chitinophagaceae bacterium]
MAEVILMPRLSDTMTEGVIAEWHKKVGDPVKKGDLLAEVETDKATMELESYKDGTLLHIGTDKGGKLQVNDLLAIIGTQGEDISSLIKSPQEADQQKVVDPDQSIGITGNEKESKVQQPLPGDQQPVADPDHSIGITSNENGRVKASPLAKKIAKEKGVDLKHLHGSGDGGRITKADIDNYTPATADGGGGGFPRGLVLPTYTLEEGYTDIPNSQIRGVIAKRLGESKFSAPHFYLTMEINMDNTISARAQLNEVSPVKISFNDLIVKAAALALKQHPAVNASWMADKIRRWHHIHVGIAVAIEDGLIVPVIRFADQKSLPQIAAESKELSGKARTKKLQPDEFTGNTFTISNLGMMDIDEFTAIINPPDSCIMAVGRIKEIVVKKADGFAVSNVMKITLSCDHRSVDGATGAA